MNARRSSKIAPRCPSVGNRLCMLLLILLTFATVTTAVVVLASLVMHAL